ncbi:MAG: hypothetical protein ACPL0B_01745, partial [Anaerolineales bacterium]
MLNTLVAKFQFNPGYMDAEYYFATGQYLYSGHGFVEPFLWNYLNNPASLPAPSHLYWMPLASLLAFLGMEIGNSALWFWGRLPFVFLASAIPPLTYYLSYHLKPHTSIARLAGLLALFSGFYAAYLTTTDTFAICMILGTVWILLAEKALTKGGIWFFWIGVTSGLLHLSRADGLLWFVMIFALGVWQAIQSHKKFNELFPWLILALGGYLLVMSPWYYRNWGLWHSPFPPGN